MLGERPERWLYITCDYRCKSDTCGYAYHVSVERISPDPVGEIWVCQDALRENGCA